MANDDKTEEPSSHKLSEARKKGQVFQSKELSTVVILLSAFLMVRMMLPNIRKWVQEFLMLILNLVPEEQPLGQPILTRFMITALMSSLPILVVVSAVSILIHGIQTRFINNFSTLKPDFGKLNPLNGIKRLFSLRNLVQLGEGILKIIILAAVVYTTIRDDVLTFAKMVNMPLEGSYQALLSLMWSMIVKLMALFAVLAAVDWVYQKRQFHNDMKMTKQEVKDEYKQMEGNPEIKNRIKSTMRQKAQQRMMQAVPSADVVVRNPTHFAVALKYDPDEGGAPVVVAKGQELTALRIAAVAEANHVPTIENVPLARGLYAACEIGDEIPPEYYEVVAELLVYIYRQEHREAALG